MRQRARTAGEPAGEAGPWERDGPPCVWKAVENQLEILRHRVPWLALPSLYRRKEEEEEESVRTVLFLFLFGANVLFFFLFGSGVPGPPLWLK